MILVDGVFTSRCIGRLMTALCAVETFTACMIRRDDDLCELAWGGAFARRDFKSPPIKSAAGFYRVLSVHKVETPGYDPGWRPRSPLKVGDIILRVLHIDCLSMAKRWCSSKVRPVSYVVRRLGPERWLIMDSYLPRF